MRKNLLYVFMIVPLFLSGCFSVSKEFHEMGSSIGSDFVVVTMAAMYHSANSKWPDNVEEFKHFWAEQKTPSDSSSAEELEAFNQIKSLSVHDDGMLIDIESPVPPQSKLFKFQQRTIHVGQSSTQANKYIGRYLGENTAGAKLEGDFEVEINQSSVTVNE